MADAPVRPATQLAVALLGVLLGACTAPNPAYSREEADAMVHPLADARLPDAATPDVLPPDGPAPDRAPDAPPRDSAVTDGAAPDRVPDAGAMDAAPLDPTGICPQQPELALCLRFEGTVTDESQYRTPLAVRNVAFAGGPTGKAGDLGGTSLVSIAETPLYDLDAVTIEAWVNPRVVDRRMGILDYEAQYGLIFLASNHVMCVGTNGTTASGGALTPGVWTSVACVIDQTANSLWIDGVRVASVPRSGPLSTSSTYGITVGSDGAQGNPWDGLIDNVRIWRGARTPAEVCAGALHCP
jgi:hypothetical protein